MIYVRYVNERYFLIHKQMPVVDEDVTIFEDGRLNT